ncbi:hypothetical protein PanWU01x14_039460 [Parasponia andersonii]|uniref:Reverse transcriptase zinc-binding domain-containing protein n=1 Tax=Parasponia andersonii TaxID=3476 RepID=A0A2P5DQX8_PARAD|nr:hypothetical protein PanWU01x14_039460 [Parasponia andersonii]
MGSIFDCASRDCHLCYGGLESITHLFLLCPGVKVIWFASKWNLRVDEVPKTNGLDLVRWIFDPPHILVLEKELRQEFQCFASVLIDKVWQARNVSIHEGKYFNPYQALNVINRAFLEFSNLGTREILRHDNNHKATSTRWLCPTTRTHRVFVDAVYKNGRSAAGVVAWDHVLAHTASLAVVPPWIPLWK